MNLAKVLYLNTIYGVSGEGNVPKVIHLLQDVDQWLVKNNDDSSKIATVQISLLQSSSKLTGPLRLGLLQEESVVSLNGLSAEDRDEYRFLQQFQTKRQASAKHVQQHVTHLENVTRQSHSTMTSLREQQRNLISQSLEVLTSADQPLSFLQTASKTKSKEENQLDIIHSGQSLGDIVAALNKLDEKENHDEIPTKQLQGIISNHKLSLLATSTNTQTEFESWCNSLTLPPTSQRIGSSKPDVLSMLV